MKRSQLVKHLQENGCVLLREGKKHSIYRNTATSRSAAVPRHTELDNRLARLICKELEIPKIG